MREKRPYQHSTTMLQKRFVKEYLERGKVGEAAKAAGLTETYGSKLLKAPKIQKALTNAMEKAGITDAAIAKKVKEGLDATTPPVDGGERGGGRPEWPDFGVRREYLDFAAKVRGDYAPELHEERQTRLEITVDLNSLRGMVESGVLDAAEIIEVENIEARAASPATGPHQSPVAGKTQLLEAEVQEKT